ncbi:MAG: T9SS type A sorting domain-containing protein [Chitinophagales bacterium]|nr:T9SS type A sorting domain-containing protein [Chitinophagales bacterium]
MKHTFFISLLLLFGTTIHAQTIDWAAPIGGHYTDRALSVIIDAQGNKYIGGHFNDTVDFDLGAGPAFKDCTPDALGRGNAFVLKLDATDNFVKVLTFGNPLDPRYIGVTSMKKDASGNLFLLGYFNTTVDFDPDTAVTHEVVPISTSDIFLVKLDANENFLWAKNWADNFPEGSNNGGDEEGPAMTIDASGNVCIAGRYKETVDFDPDTSEYELTSMGQRGYVLKFDNNGNFLWVKSIDADTVGGALVFPRSIASDASGNLYVSGDFIGAVDFDPDTVSAYTLTDSIQKGFLLKLSANGSFQWAKQMGGVGASAISTYNFVNAVAVDGASNVLVAGSFMGTVSMGSTTLISKGYSDIFISKLDASGNYLWAKSIGNTWDGERATRMTIDAANNVYIAGTYKGGIDFDPGAYVKNITSVGALDAFLLKLNTNGTFNWVKSFGGSDNTERIYSVAVKDNSIYTVGRFMTQINCDNDGSYYINASYIGSGTERFDGWVAKINQGVTGINENVSEFYFTIYPNPTSNEFIVDLSASNQTNIQAALFDINGRKIRAIALDTPITKVDVSSLHKGLYFLQLQGNDNISMMKLLVE